MEVPVFEQGCGAVDHPVAPRGVGGLRGQAVGCLGFSVFAQCAQDGFGSQHSHVEVIAGFLYLAGQVAGYGAAQAVGHDAPVQGYAQFGLYAVGIGAGLWVEVFAVDGFAGFGCEGGVACVVVGPAEQAGCAGQYAGVYVEVGGGGQFFVGA